MQVSDRNWQGREGGGAGAFVIVGGMKLDLRILAGLLAVGALAVPARAHERRFTYIYEPETQLAGALEFENWVTLGTQRNSAVGQDNYNEWHFRQELEYGVTDRYTLGLYLNEKAESFRHPSTGANESSSEWDGISLENRFNVLNPADHAVGLTLYLEGRYSGEEAEIEEKIILGQRYGDWKWAVNFGNSTEWSNNLRDQEGEFEASFGLARDLSKHWSVGMETRGEMLAPDYKQLENAAVFLGPVVSYRHDKWWAALTVLPQIYGWNRDGSLDRNSHFDLVDHTSVEVRLLIGIDL
jgi:hypothetical protein